MQHPEPQNPQVFIRGGNYIATDWMLRWSATRYRTEVRMHAEVRSVPPTFCNQGVLQNRAAGIAESHSICAGLRRAGSLDNFPWPSVSDLPARGSSACAWMWDGLASGVARDSVLLPLPLMLGAAPGGPEHDQVVGRRGCRAGRLLRRLR